MNTQVLCKVRIVGFATLDWELYLERTPTSNLVDEYSKSSAEIQKIVFPDPCGILQTPMYTPARLYPVSIFFRSIDEHFPAPPLRGTASLAFIVRKMANETMKAVVLIHPAPLKL